MKVKKTAIGTEVEVRETWRQFWVKHSKRAVVIFLLVKTVMGLQNVLYPKPSIPFQPVTHRLESVYDQDTDTFSVLDTTGISFLIMPRGPCADSKIVFAVLTAPNNVMKRETLRRQLGSRQEVFLLFLLGSTESSPVQESLMSEAVQHGDLLQISVIDHYTKLSYKTLSSFVWTNRFCGSAKYIAKIDDDITMDLDQLLFILDSKYGTGQVPDIIECPSTMKNMRPWRQNHTRSIMGKWAISPEDMSRRVFPDFCPGWLYVTTPRAGLAMAEVSVVQADDKLMRMARLDDIFVTGFVRERVEGLEVKQFQDGWSGHCWNSFFSHCPFLGITKNIFYNSVVLDKGSGKTSYIKGQKFYWCAFLEFFILENLEYLIPSITQYTAPAWTVCHRE
jgi:hypothetical protein